MNKIALNVGQILFGRKYLTVFILAASSLLLMWLKDFEKPIYPLLILLHIINFVYYVYILVYYLAVSIERIRNKAIEEEEAEISYGIIASGIATVVNLIPDFSSNIHIYVFKNKEDKLCMRLFSKGNLSEHELVEINNMILESVKQFVIKHTDKEQLKFSLESQLVNKKIKLEYKSMYFTNDKSDF